MIKEVYPHSVMKSILRIEELDYTCGFAVLYKHLQPTLILFTSCQINYLEDYFIWIFCLLVKCSGGSIML